MTPVAQRLADAWQAEGTPEGYAKAHDIKLIDETLDEYIRAAGSHWHSQALSNLLQEAYVPEAMLTISRMLSPEHIILYMANLFECFFMTGLLIGEGSEHITPCNCERKIIEE